MADLEVPFFRPDIGEREIAEVVATLRSGWLTTGPRVERFEREFAAAVGARGAVALNSCTAALHLAVEALGLGRGQGVLVPGLTFAATAEVVRYLGGVPLLVDCDPDTLLMDLEAAEVVVRRARRGELPALGGEPVPVVGMMPVHVGGLMLDVAALRAFARAHDLWVVEDAAHAFPAAWRAGDGEPWRRCGEATADVSCFSFYANKTITTGEGGMAVGDDPRLLERMRTMSLHGLSSAAWSRYSGGSWDYRIVAPGFKYNMTDLAAAIGLHQLERAESLRRARVELADAYRAALADLPEIELPVDPPHRLHAWHLFPIRLRLERLTATRDEVIAALTERGVRTSVHWRPLNEHPYYGELGWRREHLPRAASVWRRLISLPIFPGMTPDELGHVVTALTSVCAAHTRLSS